MVFRVLSVCLSVVCMYVSMYVCTIALKVIVALVLHLKDSVNVCRDLQRWLVGSLCLPERQKLHPSCSSIDCLLFFVASIAVQNFLVVKSFCWRSRRGVGWWLLD